MIEAGLVIRDEVPVPVNFRGAVVDIFQADSIVDNVVLVKLKALDQLIKQHKSQTMHYLRATTIEVALLMNFGTVPRFKRLVLDNDRKKSKKVSVQS